MRTIIYIRVSTEEQNTARQRDELTEWARRTGAENLEVIEEKVSGAIPANHRELARAFAAPDVGRVVVKEIDRLGRDAIDILTTIRTLTERGVNVTVTSLGVDTLLPNGKPNPAARIIFSLLSTLAEMERERTRERQREGIAIAKRKGKYNGRQPGTSEAPGQVLDKYPHVVRELKRGTSVRRAAKLCDVSPGTVQRVRAALVGT